MKIKNIIFSGLFCCKSEDLNESHDHPRQTIYTDGRNEIYNEYIKIIDKNFEIPEEKNLENLLDFYKKEIEQIKFCYYNSYKNLIESNILEEHQEKISIKLKEKERKLTEILLKEIENLNLKKNTNNDNETKKILVGSISVGKSKLINYLFGTNEKIGRRIGRTTNEIKEVHSNNKVKIYDSPGLTEPLDDLTLNTLKNICNFDQVYILSDVVKDLNKLIVQIISKIFSEKDIFFVITNCDSGHSKEDLSIYISCIKDFKKLGIHIKEDQIFTTSAKPEGNNFDNEKLKKSLLS